MEFIIGSIFLIIAVGVLLYCCKNLTVNININYPDVKVPELSDLYDDEGDPKGVQDIVDYDELLKEINNLMLDQEEESNE